MNSNRFLVAAMLMVAIVSGPAVAQETALMVRQPIEITADSLEIEEERGIAIFLGNVRALQGNFLLSANRVAVAYAEEGAGVSAVTTIDAHENVFFSTPNETAQGDSGFYDVENGIFTLTGSVVLTRGETVIRGSRLVLDLNTGLSRLEGSTEGNGRVRGLFVPNAAASGGAGP